MDYVALKFAVAPQAERVAIGIDQIGKRLQFDPLLLIVRIVEVPWIGTFAGCLHFDEPDKRIRYGDCEIGACLHFSESRLANEVDGANGQSYNLRQFLHERFERSAKLIFRRAGNGDARQFGFYVCAEIRDGFRDCLICQFLFPPAIRGAA